MAGMPRHGVEPQRRATRSTSQRAGGATSIPTLNWPSGSRPPQTASPRNPFKPMKMLEIRTRIKSAIAKANTDIAERNRLTWISETLGLVVFLAFLTFGGYGWSAEIANRVLELAGDEHDRPLLYGGSYVEYVDKTGREAPGVHA